MSLLSFVKRPDVRAALDQVIPVLDRTQRVPVLVPSNSRHPAFVGTAFDYAMRFELHRTNPRARDTRWVAEEATVIAAWVAKRLRVVGPGATWPVPTRKGSMEFTAAQISEAATRLKKGVTNARKYVERYGTLAAPTKRDRQALARHALFLARADAVVRVHRFDAVTEEATPDEVREIAELLAIIPGVFRVRQPLVLNPTFGTFSELVGGADADLILGSMLVDIKTVKHACVEREMARQLIGYVLLGRALRAAGPKRQRLPEVDKVGIYFSRYGHLWTMPTSRVVEHHQFREVESWFLDTARALHRTTCDLILADVA